MITSIQPSDISFLVEVSTSGTLIVAAQKMGVSVAAVSKRLAQLEARSGAVLVTRTARKLALTPEGEAFLHHGRRILAELEDLHQALSASIDEPRGLLRVCATLGFGRRHIAPAVAAFSEAYPEVEVRLTLSESVPSMVDDACDLSIRFGEPPDSRSIARLLSTNERVICAAPAYLAARGIPASPADLVEHECIDIQQGQEAFGVWRFRSAAQHDADLQAVKIRGRLATNDGATAMAWALAGRGLIMRSRWDADEHLKNGDLVEVLVNWRTPAASIYAVYSQKHRASLRVKSFVDYLESYFSERVV